jgi:hypothetical protein
MKIQTVLINATKSFKAQAAQILQEIIAEQDQRN